MSVRTASTTASTGQGETRPFRIEVPEAELAEL
jgi:hypothetical protein